MKSSSTVMGAICSVLRDVIRVVMMGEECAREGREGGREGLVCCQWVSQGVGNKGEGGDRIAHTITPESKTRAKVCFVLFLLSNLKRQFTTRPTKTRQFCCILYSFQLQPNQPN